MQWMSLATKSATNGVAEPASDSIIAMVIQAQSAQLLCQQIP